MVCRTERGIVEEYVNFRTAVASSRRPITRCQRTVASCGIQPGSLGLNREVLTAGIPDKLQMRDLRRIGGETVHPAPNSPPYLYWALLASGQITMRKVDGWQSLAEKRDDKIIDLAA